MRDWPEGVDRIVADELASTNQEGRRLAGELTAPTWILAHRQTLGRGRLDRMWVSLPGNLHATLVMPLRTPPRYAPRWSLIASLAVRDALAEVAGEETSIRIKWPNDVLLDGGKTAGLLLETAGSAADPKLLVGVGINLGSAPSLPERSGSAPVPTCLNAATGATTAPLEMLTLLARSFARRECQFVKGGFEPIRLEWLQHAHGLEEEVIFRMSRSEIQGRFVTVDSDGSAVVLSDGVRRTISSAEMSVC